jgi:hypothetical protein
MFSAVSNFVCSPIVVVGVVVVVVVIIIIIMVIKLRRLHWAGHVARREKLEIRTQFWSENLKGRDHLEDVGVDGRIILKWILRKWDVTVWTGCICVGQARQ